MRLDRPLFFPRNKGRLGLSGTVVALILVIIGVSLALLVGSIVGGQIGGWARKEGIIIEDVTATLVGSPGSLRLCVTVQVKNTGGSVVTGLQGMVRTGAQDLPISFSPDSVNPGSSASASQCYPVSNIGRGDMATVVVSGNVPGGSTTHQRSVPIV